MLSIRFTSFTDSVLFEKKHERSRRRMCKERESRKRDETGRRDKTGRAVQKGETGIMESKENECKRCKVLEGSLARERADGAAAARRAKAHVANNAALRKRAGDLEARPQVVSDSSAARVRYGIESDVLRWCAHLIDTRLGLVKGVRKLALSDLLKEISAKLVEGEPRSW